MTHVEQPGGTRLYLPAWLRRSFANLLALTGAFALVGVFVELASFRRGDAGAWYAVAVLVAVTVVCWWLAFTLNRSPRSLGATTGHIVLFETPMLGVAVGQTPALTIRGARDAVERFIPLEEFGDLFGGWMIWAAPARPTRDLPGEALGVWSRRTCSRFRRVLRERGATLEVRREPGPDQRMARYVTMHTKRDRGLTDIAADEHLSSTGSQAQ